MSEKPMDDLSGRHPVNIGHLVMGLAFAGLVAVWAVIQADAVELSEARWLLPLPWLVAGAIGLVATGVVSRRRPGPDAGWVGESARAEESAYDDSGATEDTTVIDETTDPTEEIR
jgi:hypothetical protein